MHTLLFLFFFFVENECDDHNSMYFCMNCWDFDEPFWRWTVFQASTLIKWCQCWDLLHFICLMEQNKCYPVYTFRYCEVSISSEPPLMHQYQISISSGNLDFKLYIAVPLRSGEVFWKTQLEYWNTQRSQCAKMKKKKHKKWGDDNLYCNVNEYICIILMRVNVFIVELVIVQERARVSPCMYACVYVSVCAGVHLARQFYVHKCILYKMNIKHMIENLAQCL